MCAKETQLQPGQAFHEAAWTLLAGSVVYGKNTGSPRTLVTHAPGGRVIQAARPVQQGAGVERVFGGRRGKTRKFAVIAQLAERLISNQPVVGSKAAGGTSLLSAGQGKCLRPIQLLLK